MTGINISDLGEEIIKSFFHENNSASVRMNGKLNEVFKTGVDL